ncbi:hypothetical protein SAMN04487833_14812 [Sarcina sp. DSM 11001]|nr:hypothetical protein SAMN04487833_14812 [Sarcina sp. DSM 11001]
MALPRCSCSGLNVQTLGAFSLGYAIGKDRGRSDSESKTQK